MSISDQYSVKNICIIGAGAAGLATLKVLKESRQYRDGLWVPFVFEARENVGGVWLPAPPVDDPPLTPIYDSLTTNLPHSVMAYSDYSFPPSTPVYPRASVVLTYLQSYAEHFGLIPHIQFNTTVSSVEHKPELDKWEVKVNTGETFTFDMIVVCNGHYRVPRYPNAPGLDDWLRRGKASHSVWYRHPERFGNTVLVVGAGPSGEDISADLLLADGSCIIIRSITGAVNKDKGNLKIRGRLTRFEDVSLGQVVFEDGTVENGISYCIMATGYKASFPFLSKKLIQEGTPALVPPLPSDPFNTTYGVFPLAKHIFPLKNTTIAFVALSLNIIPFPLAECQACAVFHAFSNPDALDLLKESAEIITRYKLLRESLGDDPFRVAKGWDVMGMTQFDYRDQLCDFAMPSYGLAKVEKWVKVMYANTFVLRQVWRMLEHSGEAEKWVDSVSEKQEWVQLLERLLDKVRELGLPVINVNAMAYTSTIV
ncbi:hypothetical protein APHAL10511_003402 [Amanita phalloides]|nr:hypothetical protein APHAL10511_003402 [Amanita phalloides]